MGFCLYPDKDLFIRRGLIRAINVWLSELGTDFDLEFLINRIACGLYFVRDINGVEKSTSRNYQSALESCAKTELDTHFTEKLMRGEISVQDKKPHKIQATSAIPKFGTDLLHPVTNCSWPHANSLNSYMEATPLSSKV